MIMTNNSDIKSLVAEIARDGAASIYKSNHFKHSYDIETVIDSQIAFVNIEANTRAQAAAFAKAQGFPVRSVNMVG